MSIHDRSTLKLTAAGALLVALLLQTDRANASDDAERGLGESVGYGAASVLATLVYAPAKLAYATAGSVVGGATYLFSGADTDATLGVLNPALRGNYVVTPKHLREPRTLRFVGRRGGFDYDSETVATEMDALPTVATSPPVSGCAAPSPVPEILFASGATQLDAGAKVALERAVNTMRACPFVKVDVRAFTDDVGSWNSNMRLAQRRADAVSDFLIGSGIEGSRITQHGYGEASPTETNQSGSGRARNRRVEVVLHQAVE